MTEKKNGRVGSLPTYTNIKSFTGRQWCITIHPSDWWIYIDKKNTYKNLGAFNIKKSLPYTCSYEKAGLQVQKLIAISL